MGYGSAMLSLLSTMLFLQGCDGSGPVAPIPPPLAAQSPVPAAVPPLDQRTAVWPPGVPYIDGPDARLQTMAISLELVAEGFEEPTDIQFVPGSSTEAVVLEKAGRVLWGSMASGQFEELLRIPVATPSEQGLLGAAFHPDFAVNGLIFLRHSEPRAEGASISVVSRYRIQSMPRRAEHTGEVLRVPQPHATHNSGQLLFGPDGMLYIGWGDGGWDGSRVDGRAVGVDFDGHGQNPATWLGSMQRIDVDRLSPGRQYAIPPDNPWVDSPGAAPEAWAIGFRNPWRYSFTPDGRLVVADVGQDSWEEVSIVARGENHGWSTREGSHCFEPATGCTSEGLTPPVYEYDHRSGRSITGGYVYTGPSIPDLVGRYVFGDFVSGRIWAITLPGPGKTTASDPRALGRWTMMPSTFGQAADGEIYVADFSKGRVFRLSKAAPQ